MTDDRDLDDGNFIPEATMTTPQGTHSQGTQPQGTQPERIDDPAEKLALGATPDDDVVLAPARSLPWVTPGPAIDTQLAQLRAVLNDDPALYGRMVQEVEAAWQRVGGDRAQFLRETAGPRAELLSRAWLHAVRGQAVQVTDDFLDAVTAYLEEVGGRDR
jgi:hypothetical protein